ncbi:MAG: diaminopimelate epimerase [Bacteroidetes bacterium]|nr:diaminopimelate epimerase [Bacteroidota bacterium]
MQLSFSKYQGTGNDFIILDGWNSEISISAEQVKYCCDRRFGIGGDGLMIIKKHPSFDFEMIYFNSDGLLSSMCGNGGRCLVHFAFERNYIGTSTKFLAVDGVHEADVLPNHIVSLKMSDVSIIEKRENDYYLNTGSPHFVKKVDEINELDVVEEGRKIRYNEEFKSVGTNVNFVKELEDGIMVRTYERGVENETLSCGTGVTAAALVVADLFNEEKRKRESINIKTLGGALKVTFNRNENIIDEIRLIGPATFVYEGSIKL